MHSVHNTQLGTHTKQSTHMHTQDTHTHASTHTHMPANLRDVEERNEVDKGPWQLLSHLLQNLYKMPLKVVRGQEGNIA